MMESMINLEALSEEEKQLILSVIKRDEELRRAQDVRISQLKAEIQNLRLQSVLRDGDDLNKMCARCHKPFGFFFDSGDWCQQCRFKVCNACRETMLTGGWLCLLCYKQMQMKILTGEWIHSGASRPHSRKPSGADVVKASIRLSIANGNVANNENETAIDGGERDAQRGNRQDSATSKKDDMDRVGYPKDSDKKKLTHLFDSFKTPRSDSLDGQVDVKHVSCRRHRDSDSDTSSSSDEEKPVEFDGATAPSACGSKSEPVSSLSETAVSKTESVSNSPQVSVRSTRSQEEMAAVVQNGSTLPVDDGSEYSSSYRHSTQQSMSSESTKFSATESVMAMKYKKYVHEEQQLHVNPNCSPLTPPSPSKVSSISPEPKLPVIQRTFSEKSDTSSISSARTASPATKMRLLDFASKRALERDISDQEETSSRCSQDGTEVVGRDIDDYVVEDISKVHFQQISKKSESSSSGRRLDNGKIGNHEVSSGSPGREGVRFGRGLQEEGDTQSIDSYSGGMFLTNTQTDIQKHEQLSCLDINQREITQSSQGVESLDVHDGSSHEICNELVENVISETCLTVSALQHLTDTLASFSDVDSVGEHDSILPKDPALTSTSNPTACNFQLDTSSSPFPCNKDTCGQDAKTFEQKPVECFPLKQQILSGTAAESVGSSTVTGIQFFKTFDTTDEKNTPKQSSRKLSSAQKNGSAVKTLRETPEILPVSELSCTATSELAPLCSETRHTTEIDAASKTRIIIDDEGDPFGHKAVKIPDVLQEYLDREDSMSDCLSVITEMTEPGEDLDCTLSETSSNSTIQDDDLNAEIDQIYRDNLAFGHDRFLLLPPGGSLSDEKYNSLNGVVITQNTVDMDQHLASRSASSKEDTNHMLTCVMGKETEIPVMSDTVSNKDLSQGDEHNSEVDEYSQQSVCHIPEICQSLVPESLTCCTESQDITHKKPVIEVKDATSTGYENIAADFKSSQSPQIPATEDFTSVKQMRSVETAEMRKGCFDKREEELVINSTEVHDSDNHKFSNVETNESILHYACTQSTLDPDHLSCSVDDGLGASVQFLSTSTDTPPSETSPLPDCDKQGQGQSLPVPVTAENMTASLLLCSGGAVEQKDTDEENNLCPQVKTVSEVASDETGSYGGDSGHISGTSAENTPEHKGRSPRHSHLSIPSLVMTSADEKDNDEEDIDHLVATHRSVGSLRSSRGNLFSSLTDSRESLYSVYSDAGEINYGKIPVTGEILFGLDYNYKSGALEVHVKSCKDLAPVDTKKKRSDPYVKTYLLPDKTRSGKRKTKIKKHTLNPTFDEVLRYVISKSEVENRILWVTVWHSDRFGHNDFLGEVMISMDCYKFGDSLPKWYPLQERLEAPQVTLFPYKGDVALSLKYVPPEKVDPNDSPKKNKLKKNVPSQGELHVLIKEARNLTAVRSNGTSDPFCKGYLLPEKHRSCKQKTSVVKKNCSPSWNHIFVFDDVPAEELRERSLELTMWDHDRLTSNDFLGGVRLNLGTGVSHGKSVDWMDARGEEIAIWQSMMERPDTWTDATIALRATMGKSEIRK